MKTYKRSEIGITEETKAKGKEMVEIIMSESFPELMTG